MKRKEILKQAEKCICNDREAQYGSPRKNFDAVAALWTSYCGTPFNAVDVAVMLCLLKIGRIATGLFKDDNFVDAVGYLALSGEIADEYEDFSHE